jgi:hypothetical protein
VAEHEDPVAGSSSAGADAGDDGMVTAQLVVAIGLSLVLLATLVNLLVLQYGRGVVRAALDEGVRAGSRAAAGSAECERRAQAALADLLGGAMGSGVRVRCSADDATVTAQADVTFHGWAPGVPDWRFTARAVAVREPPP